MLFTAIVDIKVHRGSIIKYAPSSQKLLNKTERIILPPEVKHKTENCRHCSGSIVQQREKGCVFPKDYPPSILQVSAVSVRVQSYRKESSSSLVKKTNTDYE